MQIGFFIAKKLSFENQQGFTKTITILATLAVAVSIAVVIIAFGILLGFKQEIRGKVTGYGGDITVSSYQLTSGSENSLLDFNDSVLNSISSDKQIESVYPYLNKAGILKTDSLLEGLIFKGIPHNYDLSFYRKHLVKGNLPEYSDSSDSYDILLSESTALLLNVDTSDRLNLFFIQNGDVKLRRPEVVGIYNTGLTEFDKKSAIADIRMLQRVVTTEYTQIGGYEIKVADFEKIDKTTNSIQASLPYSLSATSIIDNYPTIFQWLEIVDTNVIVIIALMFVVAVINIVTVLLILIIERVQMIGILKSLGANNKSVLGIFSYQGLFILLGGVIIGNAVALSLGLLQSKYKLLGLSADTYYMDSVPFHLPLSIWILINAGAIVVCFLFTFLPASVISRITPVKSLKFN